MYELAMHKRILLNIPSMILIKNTNYRKKVHKTT